MTARRLKSIPSNEVAAELAKAAADTTENPPRLISVVTAKALITDPPPNRPREAMVSEKLSWKADCMSTSNRADAVFLTHLHISIKW